MKDIINFIIAEIEDWWWTWIIRIYLKCTFVQAPEWDNFEKVNETMGQLFDEPYPARAAYEVAKLPKNSSIEIETIAYQGSE